MKLLIEEKTAKKKTQKIYPAAAGRFLLSPDFSVTSDPIAVKIIAKDAKDTESTQASQVPIRVSGRGSETGGKVIIKELNDKQDNQLLKDLNDISIAPIHITTKKAFALFGFLKNLTKYIAYPAASAALLAGLLLSIIFLGNFLGPIQKTLSLAPSAAWSLLVADDTDAVPEAEPLDDSALAQETLEPADVSEPSTQEESLQPSSQEAPADSSNSDLEAPTDNQTTTSQDPSEQTQGTSSDDVNEDELDEPIDSQDQLSADDQETTSQDPSEQTQGTSSDDVNEDELDEPIDSQDQLSADDQETTGSDATQETPDPDTSAQVPFLSGKITESEGDLLGANQSPDAGEEPEQNQPGNDQAQVLEPDPDEKVVPVITQEPTETGKLVTISAPDEDPENPITNFPATAKIPEIFKVGQQKKIQITWKNNGNQQMPFEAKDTDGNGYLDTVDWIVPHLSEQLFDIAYISKAFQLDQNKDILADVYEQVWAKDDSYANLEQGQYLRLTFDQAFTSQNNITVYAKSDTGASIEVYPVYPDGPEITQPVATFETIQGEGFYKVLLTNLSAPTDVFDLKILQNVSVDYVVYTDFDYGPNSILTPQGYKNISELTVGDQVIGYENGQAVTNQIENIQFLKPGSRDRWRQDEQGNNIILVETPFTYYLVNETWHLFQDQSLWANDRVVHASELTVGDTIYDTNYQPITITSIRSGEDRVQWLTLTVSGNHSYVADGLLLHNASRYWVGGGSSANWNATGNTNWASSSNGSNNASVPTSSDDVFFDGVGGGASNSTLSANITIRSLNMTGYTNTLTHNSAVTLSIGDGTAGASNNALIFGSLTYTKGSTTTSAISFISTSTTAQNVNGNDKTLGNVTFNGAGGSWKLTGTFTADGNTATTVTLTQGSLEANGQAMNLGRFASSNSNTRTLNLNLIPLIALNGTGTAWNLATTTNLTFSMDSSQITLSGSGADFAGGGLSYNNVSLTGPASQEVSGANTFMSFTRTGNATKTNVLVLADNQTVTSGFTIQGNSTTNRLLIESDTIGTSRTITQNALIATIANVDFSDITGAGTGSWDLSAITGNSGDAGGNSGITFTTATTRYWVGGTGSWSSTGEWATSSGGAGGAYVPLPQDAVVFDANSFSAGSQTVTADMPRLGKSINWTGATNSPTLALTSTANTIYGSLTLISTVTISTSQTTSFEGRGSFTLTSAGTTLGPVTVAMVGGTLTLQDHFSSDGALTINNGTFAANNKNVTALRFSSSNSNTRTITMGSGTWTATGTGTVWSTSTTTGLTLNANTSTIKITDTSTSNLTFAGGGQTFNNVWWSRGASTGSNITSGSNTFADFKDDGSAAHSLLFTDGSTQTVTTFTVSGSSGNVITINTNGSTATHALVKSGGGTISSDYLNIQHSVATPSNTWYAGANSTDNQSVATAGSGWIFSGVPSITIGGTVYTDEGTTNIGANKTVAVSINGAAAAGTDDTDASGAYSITGLNIVAGDILTLYLDGETEKAVTVTAASGSNQTNVHLFQNYLIGRHDNSGSLTNANLETAETNADSDISSIYSVASSNLTVAAGKSLYIPSSHTFAPGGTVSVGGNFSNNGTFTHGSSTVTLTGTSTQTLKTNSSSLNNLTINASGGTYTLQDHLTAVSDFILTQGIFNANDKNVTIGSFSSSNSNTRTVTMGAGTWTLTSNNTTIWQTGTMTNLTFNRGSNAIVANYSGSAGIRKIVLSAWDEASAPSISITAGSDQVQVSRSILNLNFTGFSGTLSEISTRTIYGNLTLSSSMTIEASTHATTFGSTSTGKTITTNGITLPFPIIFDGVGGGWTLQDNTTISDVLTITNGTLNGGSVILTLSGTSGAPFSNSGTFNAATGTVAYTGNNSGGNTTVANVTYNNLTLNNSSETFVLGAALDVNDTLTLTAGTLDISGSNYGITAKSWTDTDTGTFTEGSGTVTFDVAGGTINSNETFENVTINHAGTTTLGAALDLDDTLTLSGGALDVSGSNYGITLKSWTGTGSGTFTEQSGTVTFDVAGGTINSNEDFYNVTVNHGGTSTLGANTSITNVLTITSGTLNASSYTLTLSGTTGTPFSNSGTFTASTGTVAYTGNNSGGNTTIANVTYNNLTLNNGSETYVLGAALDVDNTLTLAAGTLDVSASNYGITAKSWTDTGSGTFTEGSGTVTFDVAGGTINSNETFENVTINHAGTTTLGAALDLDDTLIITAGALDVSGSNFGITLKSWTDTGSGTFTEGSGTVTFDVSGGTLNSNETFENVTINHAGTTTLGAALDLDDTLTITAGALDVSGSNYGITTKSWTDTGSGTFTEGSGTVTFDVAGGTINSNETFENVTINHAGTTTLGAALDLDDTLTITSGALDVSGSNYGITLKSWTGTGSGTFTEQSGTVTFDVAGGTINSNETFENVTIDHAGTTTLGAALDLDDTLTITGGALDVSGSNYGITLKSWTDTGAGTFTEQSGTVTFDITGGTINSNETFENVTINHAGTTTLGAALDLDDTLTLSGGALDVSSSNYGITLKSWTDTGSGTFTEQSGTVTFDGTGTINANETFSSVTINSSGTVTLGAALDLADTLTLTAGTLDISGGNYGIILKSWTDTGSGTFTEQSGTVTFDVASGTINSNETFENVTINHAGTTTLGAALDLDGKVTITAGTLDASASNYAITLAGNWSNAGTFTARAGTVTLDGTSQSISGSASFYNLSKTVTSAATLTFEAAATQTIASGGTVTFHGASGQLLSLVSSSSPTQWKITVNGSTSMDYLSVKDSDASGGIAIAQTNSTDSGHNLNWLFNQDPVFSSISHTSGYIKAGNTVIFTATASDPDSGDTITLYICKANDFTGTACGAGGEWAHSSASATNPTAIYTVQSSDADGSHAYYANIIDNDNAEASANPSSGAFTTDVTAPIVDAGADQSKPDPFVTAASASDALSGVSSYQWSQTSGPGTLTFGSDTSLNTTVSANANGTYLARLTVTDGAGNTAYDEFSLVWSGSTATTTTSGGGGGRGNPCTVPECGIQTTEPLPEPDVTDPSEDTGVSPDIGQQIGDIIDTIGDAISDIIFPKPKPEPLPLPPIETVVTQPAPIALQGIWDLLFGKQIREFLFAPLSPDIKNLIAKLPELQKTFKATGIVTLNSTVQKLQGIELTVPGLGWRLLTQTDASDPLPGTEFDPPGFALPKHVPLANLPITLKKELPTEIVFFRSNDELIDYRTIISLNDKGEAEQKINVISGNELVLAVKPEAPADSVKGYIILRSLALHKQGLGLPSQVSSFDTVFGSVALAAAPPPQPIQSHILLSEFDYADGDGDGVYTANVQAPLVDGQYEVITVINYKDITIGSHQLRLIMVVDPEGYVYRSVSGGELRISNAAVSLHWLNPQTKEYQLWPAEEYQQENPRVTDKTGKYSFLVPEGLYYLEVSAPGYDKFRSETFTVKEGEGIHMNIQLQSQHWSEGMWGWKGLAMAALALLMSFVYVIFIGNKRR